MPLEQEVSDAEVADDLYIGGERDANDEIIEGDRGDELEPEQTEDPELAEEDTGSEEGDGGDDEAVGDSEGHDTADEPADEGDSDEDGDGQVEDNSEQRIPKKRFDQVNERMKLAEQKLAEMEAKLAEQKAEPEAPAYDFDAKEQQYAELVIDGEIEKARELRAEIRAAEKAEFMKDIQIPDVANVANTQYAFNQKVAELNAEFSEFNPESPSYDQVLVDEVLGRQQYFLSQGHSAASALDKAAREVAKLNDIVGLSQVQVEETPPPAKPPAKKADIKKKAKQAQQQPPVMEEGGQNDATPNIIDMSDDEFDALPESTKARLRGDLG
jgi:hypothetical protein